VRAMGLELERLTHEADQAGELRAQLATGAMVVELGPELLEPSFIKDRLAPTGDVQYAQLLGSIRGEGQKIPILVRPHPERSGHYQIAYGHRRWQAARELGIKVKAIVQVLSDAELVIAQGKENSERRNLSFIERALFAANLDAAGFERATINAALAVHTAETSRLLGVVNEIPAELIKAIGPAPKAGRNRWLELAKHLQSKDAEELASRTIGREDFTRLGSNARFDVLIASLRTYASRPGEGDVIKNKRGEAVAQVMRSGQTVQLRIDNRVSPGFGGYLISILPEIVRCYDEEAAASGSTKS